jgi:hypothetical protein
MATTRRREPTTRRSVAEIARRCARAWQEKEQWRDLHEDCFEYAMPNRNSLNKTTPGEKKVDRVFDSTAIESCIAFANRIQSDLMPPFKKFLRLAPGPAVPKNQRDGLQRKLELITDTVFAYVHASNFDTSANETLLDLGIGTGVMLCMEGNTLRPLNYVPVSIVQVALEEGPWGSVSGVYRKHKVRVENILGQWPDAKVPARWLEDAKADPKAEKELIEATYFVTYGDGTADEVWCYDVVEAKDEKRLVKRLYENNPWLTPRWQKLPGETYGRGPVVQALPDIKTLNKIVELLLRNAALAISGVYTGVEDGTLNPNTAQIIPGSIIPVASNGGSRGPSLMELKRSGSFDLANLEIEKYRMGIKRMMFDRQLPPDEGAVRSATEIVARIKELARDIGAPFGRLHSEFLVPWMQNTIEILARRGLVPRIDIDGVQVQVQVISPLAQEQNIADVEIVVRWLSILGALSPELVMMGAKSEDLPDWLADKLGVPAILVRDENERKQHLEDIKRMAAAEQAASTRSNVVPIGSSGVPGIQTAAAAGGVAPFARMAA